MSKSEDVELTSQQGTEPNYSLRLQNCYHFQMGQETGNTKVSSKTNREVRIGFKEERGEGKTSFDT